PRGLAQLLSLRRVPARRPRPAAGAASAGRPALPDRAAAHLQPQVLPEMAPALLLRRALGRPAGGGPRVPARGVAPDTAGPVGEVARPRRPVRVAVAVLAVLVASTTLLRGGSALARPGATGISDWPEFGYDPARQNVGPASPGITVANVGRLRRHRIQIDGTVDSSAVYL